MKQTSFLLLLCILAACGNKQNQPADTEQTDNGHTWVPAVISYQIVNIYPHDTTAFTEGLQYVNGRLYESSGQYGVSDIRIDDLTTGKVLKKQQMDKQYFGEGLTVLNGKVYQLTYKAGTGFVYDAATLKPEKQFTYNTGEGWGMTSDGTHLIYSDGTNTLHYLDTATLQQAKTLSVNDEHGPVDDINELEYIKGYIYANQWRTNNILKIDPHSGRVVGRADLGDLRQRIGMQPVMNPGPYSPDVMNGIAYDAATNHIFITGKYWPKLIEIKLDN